MNDASSNYNSQVMTVGPVSSDAASNTSSSCAALTAEIKGDLRTVPASTLKTLEIYFGISDKLHQIKAIFSDNGAFGRYVDTEFQWKTAWRYRVMSLSPRKKEIYRAIAWAQEREMVVSYSVDRALKLVAEYKRSFAGSEAPVRKSRSKSPSLKEQNAALAQELRKLRERYLLLQPDLSQEQARITQLGKDPERERTALTAPPEPNADTQIAE